MIAGGVKASDLGSDSVARPVTVLVCSDMFSRMDMAVTGEAISLGDSWAALGSVKCTLEVV